MNYGKRVLNNSKKVKTHLRKIKSEANGFWTE